jgi:hypothetical protein
VFFTQVLPLQLQSRLWFLKTWNDSDSPYPHLLEEDQRNPTTFDQWLALATPIQLDIAALSLAFAEFRHYDRTPSSVL